jgi:hypothetical protein
MTTTARRKTTSPPAAAVRQALRLCEADPVRHTWNTPSPPGDPALIPSGQRGTSPITAKAALRAVGVPPLAAAALRRRLRLTPEQEAER